MAIQRESLLKTILSQPTAPYREGHVIRVVTHELKNAGIPHFLDPVGNIVIGVSSRAEYLRLFKTRSKEPVRVFIAHMDHPGFHGVRWISPEKLEVQWFGGTPTQHLVGAPVWLADKQGWVAEGHILEAKLLPSGRSLESGIIELPADDRRHAKAPNLYGGFRFRGSYWQEGEIIYTKAADDLVGVFSILSTAMDLFGGKKKRAAPPFIGLLTRAEEVGFIGAIGHFELGWTKKAARPVVGVSLETSRTLPGAEIGKGPVVRLGDRMTVFNTDALRLFTDLAEKVLPGKYQRRIMDGGSCEATAASAYGIPCVGISVPLGNYHNQCFEGGPDSCGPLGPAPEFVHLGDVEGLLTLCQSLMQPKLNWADPWKDKRASFSAEFKKSKALLAAGH